MTYEKFCGLIKTTFPDCKEESIPIWKDFAMECVSRGQFANFERMENPSAAIEKWLDTLYAGFSTVKQQYGQTTATSIINLSCEQCCLYPGEMLQAAVCLQKGDNVQQILAKIDSGEIEAQQPFFPVPKRFLNKSPVKIQKNATTKSTAKNKKRSVER